MKRGLVTRRERTGFQLRAGKFIDTRALAVAICLLAGVVSRPAAAEDHLKELQRQAVWAGKASWGHWGPDPNIYTGWATHSNRLVPVLTFGITLDSLRGDANPYHAPERLARLYGRLPEETLNPQADYFDQTGVYDLQCQAVAAGKKYVILIVFDGMDWQTCQAAAIHASGHASYDVGRGSGLSILDYSGVQTDYGYFVCSPHSDGVKTNPSEQTLRPGSLVLFGGYDAGRGGPFPWSTPADPLYPIAKNSSISHAVTDSAASATSLCAGIKTYNDAINVDSAGQQVVPLARELQEQGWAVGTVTSVPMSHATPACAYANNVSRDDYQDLTRDMVGLPSRAHPQTPLQGQDVVLGGGWGEFVERDNAQGSNFVAGNKYITSDDLKASDVAHGGRYRVAQRTAGRAGRDVLMESARAAADGGQRLLGFFGVKLGHLPFRTADGNYDPTIGILRLAETYTPTDVTENPTLADLTEAALTVLETNPKGFWLMIEPGDVDWANHDDNLDNSVGAVLSGDEAFRVVTSWVEKRSAWHETVVIVTADHGPYLCITDPQALVPPVAGSLR